jgi:predicted lipid-binding transport protein (Tim44 family)
LKKLLSVIFSAVLIFTPIGNAVFHDDSTTAEAKSYKSGKKSFSTDNNKSNNFSNFQKKDNTTNKSATTPTKKGGFSTGGLMKGLMIGGLAGLLFGSLFANMGVLGSILGLMVNVLGIIIVIAVIRKIFVFFKDKKKREEPNSWRN